MVLRTRLNDALDRGDGAALRQIFARLGRAVLVDMDTRVRLCRRTRPDLSPAAIRALLGGEP